MNTKQPVLFVEINESHFIFIVGVYDEDYRLKVIEKIATENKGIEKSTFYKYR